MTWRDTIWLTVVLLTPLLSYGGNLAFSVLMAAAGLASFSVIPPARRPSVGFALLAAVLVLACCSGVWAVWHPDLSRLDKPRNAQGLTAVKLTFQLALYGSAVCAMVAVRREAARLGLTLLAVGMVLVVVLVLIEYAGSERIYLAIKAALHQTARPDLARRNVGRAFYPLALLLWPLGLHLWRQGGRWRWLAPFLYVGALGGALAFRIDAAIVALVAGGLAVAAVLRIGRGAVVSAMTGTVAYFVLAPLIFSAHGPFGVVRAAGGVAKASWGARMEIWRTAANLIEQRPFLGWGLDASRAFPGVIPLHPHDAALQIWLELGAAGIGLAATFFAWMFVRIEIIRLRDPPLAAAAVGSLMAYLIIGALSFGIWQEWWLGLGALTVVVFSALTNARRLPRSDQSSTLIPLTPL
jgi:O-antigen ligase